MTIPLQDSSDIALQSETFVPAAVIGNGDGRELGVAVTRIAYPPA